MGATYDPKKIVFYFNGLFITGYAPGTHVTVARNEEGLMLTVGNGGDTSWSVNNNKSGIVECDLMQTSLDNDLLSAMYKNDEANANQIGPLSIADLRGTSLHKGIGRIVKFADVSYGKEQAARKWKWVIEQLDMTVGGNT